MDSLALSAGARSRRLARCADVRARDVSTLSNGAAKTPADAACNIVPCASSMAAKTCLTSSRPGGQTPRTSTSASCVAGRRGWMYVELYVVVGVPCVGCRFAAMYEPVFERTLGVSVGQVCWAATGWQPLYRLELGPTCVVTCQDPHVNAFVRRSRQHTSRAHRTAVRVCRLRYPCVQPIVDLW
jgi:hypothetical protein